MDQKKTTFLVYDHEVKSTRSVKVQCLLSIVTAPTEMAPDRIADQLDFNQIQSHMLSGSTLLSATANWKATKLMFAQTRRFIMDDDLQRTVDSFAGNSLHKA